MTVFTRGWALALTMAASTAQGANQEIRATFRPDPSQPSKNVFINQTPNSGYCADYPNQCAENLMFSIRVPVNFTSTGSLVPGDGIAVKAPANWRRLTVTNADTQEAETVEIRITGIGSTYHLSHTANELTGTEGTDVEGHRALWTTSSWVNAPAPCRFSGNLPYSPKSYGFFWKTPVEAPCTKYAAYAIPSMSFQSLDFAYELRTPNPLGMSSGDYVGNFIYTVGPGQDFDMGDVMIPADPTLSLNFTLNVQHTLKVDIPPGGEKVELLPTGGWQQWLQKGRTPEKLYHDQTFLISASSRFKMQLACERVIGDACAISNNSNDHAVPVDVRVSMPNGIGNDDGSAVSREKLSTATEQVFQSTHYVDQKPSMLHFEIQKQYVSEMLSEQGKYSGDITVVWDSDV